MSTSFCCIVYINVCDTMCMYSSNTKVSYLIFTLLIFLDNVNQIVFIFNYVIFVFKFLLYV